MKKLSIAQKALRYDEAIERAKCVIEQNPLMEYLKKGIEYILPELKENEDEKIRKAIHIYFDWLDGRKDYQPKGEYTIRDMIAWLEKQGKQKQDPCDNCKDVMLNCHNFPCIKKRAFEQEKSVFDVINEEKVDNADKVESKDYSSIDPHFGKPIDKVEPKFKQGQWIVWKDKCYKVNYNGCGYELIDQNGLSTSLEYVTVDENAHLWTIQDAKDGDVLVASDGSIFLFAGVDDCACKYYVALTTDNVVNFNEGLKHYWETSRAVHPATKEQSDALMKAMADTGYTFDFEKKELKKIEEEYNIRGGFVCQLRERKH